MYPFFSGLKVLELSSVLAGPAVGMFFAELGAQVTKVENGRGGGDLTRHWKLPVEDRDGPASAYYHSVNWNKEIIFLDFSRDDDKHTVHALLASADIVLVNFKKGDAEKFGLGSGRLRELYPALIIGEITGFRDEADRVAYDAVLQAESGIMALNGDASTGPLKLPVAFIDLFAAHQLKEGLLLALLQREKTGMGALVNVSLYGAAIASLANQAGAWLNTGVEPRASGSLHPTIAPYGEIFSCSDGESLLLAVGTDKQFASLCACLSLDQLAADERFETNPQRVVHRAELYKHLLPVFKMASADAWLKKLIAAYVPAGRVRTISQVFETHQAEGMVLQQEEPDGTISYRVSGNAFELYLNENYTLL